MAIEKSTKIKWGLAVVMVGLSVFVVNYLAKQVRMLVNTTFDMSGTAINKISLKEINITLWWKVENKSDIGFTISNQVYDVYLDGKLAKRVGNAPEIKIYPHSVARIPTHVVLTWKELFKIGKYSVELYKMLGKLPDGDFPHWWQAKIVKAGDYIGSAKHYLEGELEAPEEKSPLDIRSEVDDEVNPSGV